MKKFFTVMMMLVVTMAVMAVPEKKGLWKTITLGDGTEVRATLVGDEHGHFWKGENGATYIEQDDAFVAVDAQQIVEKAKARRAKVNAKRAKRLAPRRVSMGEQTHYTGKKKGIVILMQFTDKKFQSANNQAKYNDVLNKENYSTGNFKGSVADYFKAQSGGIFELEFDVVGPYTAKNYFAYYGKDSGGEGNDQHPDELVVEAVKAANASVNFKDYDWDDDDEVDQVFILYAGQGQADGGSSNTIWPHMYDLESTEMALTLDGVKINTYACSNEVDTSNNIEGIGCFCHEFSHCMGFPDFYDTSYSGWFGMGDWDLMCSGSYNGSAFRPAGYTAYEKWMSGWLEPIELTDDIEVKNLKAISEGGDAYILYNSGHRDEYYMIENRQQTKWDTALPGKGLMITHVDFDKTIWEENNPNTKVTSSDVAEYAQYGITIHQNDHQRCTLIRANNSSSEYSSAGDVYPYGTKNSLTATTTPKASLYNKNASGTKVMEKGITKITQNNGEISFVFGNPEGGGTQGGGDDPVSGDGDFEKVTANNQIVAGKAYILVNEEYLAGAGAYDNYKKYLTTVDVTISGNTVSGENLAVMTLGGSNSNGYSLAFDGQYLTTA